MRQADARFPKLTPPLLDALAFPFFPKKTKKKKNRCPARPPPSRPRGSSSPRPLRPLSSSRCFLRPRRRGRWSKQRCVFLFELRIERGTGFHDSSSLSVPSLRTLSSHRPPFSFAKLSLSLSFSLPPFSPKTNNNTTSPPPPLPRPQQTPAPSSSSTPPRRPAPGSPLRARPPPRCPATSRGSTSRGTRRRRRSRRLRCR